MSVFRHVFLRWCDVCYFFPRCCGVDSPPMSPSLLYLKPLRNSKTFLHVIYKSKKKTNLLCILNNVFQYSKIRTRKRNAKKSIKTEKKIGIQPFLESGIHWAEIRNPVVGIRNPQRGIQNPRLSWIPLHGAILYKALQGESPMYINDLLITNKSVHSRETRHGHHNFVVAKVSTNQLSGKVFFR